MMAVNHSKSVAIVEQVLTTHPGFRDDYAAFKAARVTEQEEAAVSCSVEHALYHADWLIRYALDMLGCDGRAYHPGVRSHARGAQVQVLGAIECARPENDRVAV